MLNLNGRFFRTKDSVMTEENQSTVTENQSAIEGAVAKIKDLIIEGKIEEAKKTFDGLFSQNSETNSDILKNVAELLSKATQDTKTDNEPEFLAKAEELINKGYSPENMQALNEMFKNIENPKEKRDVLNKLQENPKAITFAAGLLMSEYEQALANHIKKNISIPANDASKAEQNMLANKLNQTREVLHQMNVLPAIETPQKKEPEPQKSKARPQTAEIGNPPKEKTGFLARLKDRVEQFKLDYHYSGIVGALGYRENKGDATFLSKRFDKVGEDFPHIKKLDFNRYPNLPTFNMDFTKIDYVVLPDPKKNPNIDLTGSKLKGKVNLSAYDRVDLSKADLSQVTELDLSGCKQIELRNVDLSNVKLKLPNPPTCEIVLSDTKLPKMDRLDLSQAQQVTLSNTDFSQVNTVVMPQRTQAKDISGWPKHIDASQSQYFQARNCDMSNVEKITPPKVSHHGTTPTSFELTECYLPKVEKLDISTCGNVWLSNNDMPKLNHLKVRGENHQKQHLNNNKVENLKKVEITRGYTQQPESYANMFQTYQNIYQAVTHNHTTYKDAETGKLCPLTENQKKAIEVIKNSAQFHGDGLEGFWDTMKMWCNDPQAVQASANLSRNINPKQKEVLTEYNKALSQALGLKSYINMETLKYEKTPPLKAGERVEIPPFKSSEFNKISQSKSNTFNKWGQKQTQEVNIAQTRNHNKGR